MGIRGGAPQGTRWGAGTPTNPSGNDTFGGGGGGGGGGGSSWAPAPPASYKPTGTATLSAALDTAPSSSGYPVFHPGWQHVVANSNGIFAVYQYTDNGNHDPSSWRLRHCAAGADITVASNWTLIRDSTAAGDPQYGSPPAIETDENNNVYVLANYLPQSGEPFRGVKMYKWTPADGYTTPTITSLNTNGRASGKWSTFLDQGRKWIWFVFWADTTSPNLFAYDYNGNLQYSRQVFKPLIRRWTPTLVGSSDQHGEPHYTSLYVGLDGTVYLSWNGEAFQGGDFTGSFLSYYDVRMIYSTSTTAQFQAGTETWQGPTTGQIGGTPGTRTLPIAGDDSGSQGETAYQIVKTSDAGPSGAEFIPAANASYGVNSGQKCNFSRLFSTAVNNGCVHFYYESEDGIHPAVIQHHSYARFRLPTHDIADSERRSPEFHYDVSAAGDRLGAIGGQSGGNFVQDTSQASRLYFVQTTSINANESFRVLRSDDGGLSWWLYATSPAVPGGGGQGLLSLGAHRFVQSDGSIVGSFCLADSPYTVFAYKVTPN